MKIIAFFIGLVITLLLGSCVSKVLEEVQFPCNIDENIAKVFKKDPAHGRVDILGILEQILAFVSFWVEGAAVVIAGWFAFKLGSKWQAWQHIVQVPEEFSGKSDKLEDLYIRSRVSTYLLSRFLIGTLYNILCGIGGVVAGKMFEYLFDEKAHSSFTGIWAVVATSLF